MPFTERQKELIEDHLYPDETFGEQPTAEVKLTRRQVRFLVEAVQYFHENCCPGDGKSDECGMLVWGEDAASGAIGRTPAPELWRDYRYAALRRSLVQVPFPRPGQSLTQPLASMCARRVGSGSL